MGYGQLFQNLGDAYGGPSCGYGTVTIPDTKATMPFEYEYPHLIHPATLDAIFHLLFVGLESGANMTDAAVPISMGSMFIAAELPQGVGSIFQGYTVGKMTTTREGSGSIVVSDTQWSSPKIIIHDFVACKVSGKAGEAELGLEQLCTQIQWLEDVDLARGSASEDVLATASTPALQSQIFAWLDRLCRKRSDLNVLIIQSRDDPLYMQILQRFAPLIGGRGRFDLCTVVGISEDVTSEARKTSDDESWICNWKIASLTDLVGQQMTDQTSFDLIIATQLDQCDLLDTVSLLRTGGWMVLSSLVALPENASVVARHTLPQAPSQNAGVTIATRPANPDDESYDREIDMSKPSPRSIKSSLRCKGRPLKLVARTLGSLESLQWVDDEAYVQALGDEDVGLKITGVPIHDVDAKNVMGDSLSRSIGHEAQGIVTRGGKNVNDLTPGQRVVVLYQDSCRTMIRQHRSFVVAVPSSCGFNIPPAIPLINALRAIKIAKIEESDDVLVHMAASAIGQLVIQAIQQKGARVFITLETSDQKQAMCQKYGIPSAHVLSLADMNFVKSVQRLTQGRGVDVVLNTLGDETFPCTWSCVAEGGRFIDLSESANKVMIDTTKQISYHKIDTSRVFSDRTSDVAKLLFDAYQLIESGTFDRDHHVTHFKAGDARKAFEKVHFNKTHGSVVLELDDDSCIAVAPAKPSRLELNPAATYVIPGGLGGLGPGIISMMVECGAKHIVTISRSGARSEKQKKYVQGWRDEGCHVEALCCDCTDTKQLGKFMCHAQKNKWNIRGVVQLAMVLKVSPLTVTHRRDSS
jgi:NADPH:quinone reductase-like Zn-dependent oxidoreductase